MYSWILNLGVLLFAQFAHALSELAAEPHDFNVKEALLQNGIAPDLLAPTNITARQDSAYPTCPLMCKILSVTFPDQTFARGTARYEAFRASYWSEQQAGVEPQCVFEPALSSQLSVAILSSRLTQCPFAAKSGGHAAFASASSIQDGVSISLKNFNKINIAEDHSTVDVGPGSKWQAVYEAVEQQGLVVLGGRDGDIGVGGLTTGGGISLFSTEYGWVCDNVVSYQVVTAWGVVVEASLTLNPDLYWALRGGGNNFGLVVSFRLKAFRLDDIWGGAVGWTSDAFPSLIQAYYNLAVNSPSDPKAAAILSFSATGGQLGNIAQTLLSYSQPKPVPPIFSEFAAVPNAIYNSTSIRNISDYSNNFATWPAGTRDEIWTHTSKLNVQFMTYVKDTLFDIVPRIQKQVPSLRGSVSFQALTKGMLDHMKQNGGNPLGLAGQTAPLLMLSQAWIWEDAADDAVIWTGIRDFQTRIETKATQMGINVPYRYMNYANIYQDVISSYGANNKARLKSIATKYDPTAVLQRLQPGYFKLDGAPVDTSDV